MCLYECCTTATRGKGGCLESWRYLQSHQVWNVLFVCKESLKSSCAITTQKKYKSETISIQKINWRMQRNLYHWSQISSSVMKEWKKVVWSFWFYLLWQRKIPRISSTKRIAADSAAPSSTRRRRRLHTGDGILQLPGYEREREREREHDCWISTMGSLQAVAAIVGRSHVPPARRKRSPFPKTGESRSDSEKTRLLQSRNPASEILY